MSKDGMIKMSNIEIDDILYSNRYDKTYKVLDVDARASTVELSQNDGHTVKFHIDFITDTMIFSIPNTTKKVESPIVDDSINNGGKTEYYDITSAPFPITDFDSFAEWRKLNGFQFNIGKVAWTFNLGRHSGTDELRDINKVIHYANKEKQRILRKIANGS